MMTRPEASVVAVTVTSSDCSVTVSPDMSVMLTKASGRTSWTVAVTGGVVSSKSTQLVSMPKQANSIYIFRIMIPYYSLKNSSTPNEKVLVLRCVSVPLVLVDIKGS